MATKNIENFDFMAKIVIIGDSNVGKTNILCRYTQDEYKKSHIATIGVDLKVKVIKIDQVKIKMQIWDTAGQERFHNITENYYKGAAGVILVYSVTDRRSFYNIENWINRINEIEPEYKCKILVANKCDVQQKQSQVTVSEGRSLAEKFGIQFIVSSAKQNINVSEIFQRLGTRIKQEINKSQLAGQNQGNNIKLNEKKNGKNMKQLRKDCQC